MQETLDPTSSLTEREQQVLGLLQQEPPQGARQIGEQLGVSRNAVYQTINRLKRKGALPDRFTPEGSTGGNDTPPSARVLASITQSGRASEPAGALSVTLLQELADTQQELAAIANRLAKYLA